MIFYDTETCGLHGMCVLIQWAEDDGPINLHSVWVEPIIDTLKLIEKLMGSEVCGFNLSFDHFHLCKLYTIFSQFPDCHAIPEEHIEQIALLEPKGREGQCLKPLAACDIMLHARRNKYQSTMDRRDITVRKIPSVIAAEVRDLLEKIKLDDIYFARKKDKLSPHWRIMDRDDCLDFKDIVLKFKASSALKNLAVHALKIPPEQVLKFGDVNIEKKFIPLEVGYAPFALAISSPENNWKTKLKKGSGWQRGYTWPAVISRHISHWASNKLARQYAEDDVTYTRELWKHLDSPKAGDNDSELACMVGAVRWKGFKINIEGIKQLKEKAIEVSNSAPKAPNAVKYYLLEDMDDIEALIVEKSTKKVVLEEIALWENDKGEQHPAAKKAQAVLNARMAKWEVDLCDKLLLAGRFHASFNVIGALSGRMSGGDDLNPQGIKRAKYIRENFPLADKNFILCGGDFDAFEVVLAIAYYGDKELEKTVKGGKKIHALFGTEIYPNMTYEEVLNDKEKYTRAKSGIFALIYFGNEYTLKTRLGVSVETAEKAYQNFIKRFPGIGEGRKKIIKMFQSMEQPGGIGTKVKWKDPQVYIESMFGFRRYFILETMICKTLFNLAQKLPEHFKQFKGKVVRRDREQTISGAVQSALYAAAFALQANVTRAAGNHVIQSSGAEITKTLQRKIWDVQPSGINRWLVQPINSHDEIMCPTILEKVEEVQQIVNETIESFKSSVPLIKMEWKTNLKSWADK